jgi:anti-anti-sigma regulatory factor
MRGDNGRGADGCLELRSGGTVILATPDFLDTSAAEAASKHLLSAVGQGARLLIVDMSATVICDYAAADSIMKACTLAIEAGPEIRLVAVNQLVHSLLRISGLGRLVYVYSSLADAIADPASVGLPARRGAVTSA